MNNKNCSLTKDGLILDLKTFLERELIAEASYLKSAEKVADQHDRDVLLNIAKDERRHAGIVENLIKMVNENYLPTPNSAF